MPSPIQPPGPHVGTAVINPSDPPSEFPESPLVGSSNVGAGVTGESAGNAGVSGTSVPRPAVVTDLFPLAGDGVQDTGENGVHGMSASATNSGVLRENSSSSAGVMGRASPVLGCMAEILTSFSLLSAGRRPHRHRRRLLLRQPRPSKRQTASYLESLSELTIYL
jgi:hypothetical protein